MKINIIESPLLKQAAPLQSQSTSITTTHTHTTDCITIRPSVADATSRFIPTNNAPSVKAVSGSSNNATTASIYARRQTHDTMGWRTSADVISTCVTSLANASTEDFAMEQIDACLIALHLLTKLCCKYVCQDMAVEKIMK